MAKQSKRATLIQALRGNITPYRAGKTLKVTTPTVYARCFRLISREVKKGTVDLSALDAGYGDGM